MSAAAEWIPLAEHSANWRSKLICNKEGYPRPLLENAIAALRDSPEWAGTLAFNEFSLSVVACRPTPWSHAGAWDEQQDRLTADWLQHSGIFVSAMVAAQAVETVARGRSFHPVRRYLSSLKWDRAKRIDTWLSLYLGVDSSRYSSAIGSRWLISAVARAFQPGCKADCALVLEGRQGTLKSTSLRTIAGEWFADELAEMGTKDAALQTTGVWILELSELESLSRSDVARAKSFISRSTDHFRPPYGRRPADFPRQCVFAGTCNDSQYLRDASGGRRFWPVSTGIVRITELQRDRDQLWAEAVSRYRAGAVWYLDSLELTLAAQQEQDARYDADPWEEAVFEWLKNPTQRYKNNEPLVPYSSDLDSTTSSDVLLHCIGRDIDRQTQTDKTRAAHCLTRAGWEKHRQRDGDHLTWRYRRKALE
jgi:predicted P-loop ATPase